jgi:hypothetical protein
MLPQLNSNTPKESIVVWFNVWARALLLALFAQRVGSVSVRKNFGRV